jgi:hypothetical protein
VLLAFYPVVLIAIVVIFLGVIAWLSPKIVRILRNARKNFRTDAARDWTGDLPADR